jgi:serine 3-dehydrogenase (NADP+)
MAAAPGTTRTAFVTGATSGIGEATARRLAGLGWRIVAAGRRQDRLDALAEAVGGDRLHPICVDVRDATGMDAAIAALPPDFAGIDLLVNNAGLALGTSPAQSASLDDWQAMIDTNVTALVTLTRRLLPALIERRGIIVNVSSTAASYPYPGGNVYGASKAFVRQFSLGLRSDLHGTGVRVTSLEPGMARTEFSLVRTHGDREAADALYRGWQPMTAEDIADTIAWIAQLPAHVNINRLEMMPTAQSFAGFQVARDGSPRDPPDDPEERD